MLVVGLRGLLLYFVPAVPLVVPLVSRHSCGHGPVNGYRLRRGPQKGRFAKAGYRLSILTPEQVTDSLHLL